MPGAAAKQEYGREDALRFLGITGRTLRLWERHGLVEPAETYSFQQLVALRTLARLRAAKLPTKKIQAAVTAVRKTLRDIHDPLTELRLYSEGGRIRVQVGPQRMESESGQLLLDFDKAELERMVAIPGRREEEKREKAFEQQREAEQWFLKGVEFEQTPGKIKDAIEAYSKAVELDPKLAAGHVNLGTVYFLAQQWGKATECYERALAANPDYPLAHFNIGNLFDELGDRAKALAHYLSALKLDPNYADAHYNLALLYQTSGHAMKAVRHWRTYLKLDPSSSWASIARRELDKLSATLLVSGSGAKETARFKQD